MAEKINILFVCRYNRFRSRIAEAYFNKINKNKNIKAKSTGLIQGFSLNPETIRIAKELELNINGRIQGLSSKLLAWQNIIVIVADDVPRAVFNKKNKYSKKVIIFNIKDAKSVKKEEIKRLIWQIMKKVDGLNNALERKNGI